MNERKYFPWEIDQFMCASMMNGILLVRSLFWLISFELCVYDLSEAMSCSNLERDGRSFEYNGKIHQISIHSFEHEFNNLLKTVSIFNANGRS